MSDFNSNVPLKNTACSESTLGTSMLLWFVCLCLLTTLPFFQEKNGPFIATSMSSIRHGCLSRPTDSCVLQPHADRPFVCILLFIGRASSAHFQPLTPSPVASASLCLADKVRLIDSGWNRKITGLQISHLLTLHPGSVVWLFWVSSFFLHRLQ